jgi:hypothetical protein
MNCALAHMHFRAFSAFSRFVALLKARRLLPWAVAGGELLTYGTPR